MHDARYSTTGSGVSFPAPPPYSVCQALPRTQSPRPSPVLSLDVLVKPENTARLLGSTLVTGVRDTMNER